MPLDQTICLRDLSAPAAELNTACLITVEFGEQFSEDLRLSLPGNIFEENYLIKKPFSG